MAYVKNKYCVCTTRHSECSYDLIHDRAYYDRYTEIANAAARCGVLSPEEFEKTFAQPVENTTSHEVEWFLPKGSEHCIKLEQLKFDDPVAYAAADKNRSEIRRRIEKACNDNSEDAVFLHPLMVGLDDDNLCASFDGHLVVRSWGMTLKAGRQPEEVVRMSATDHSAYKVRYDASGGGKVSFASILRLKGYVLNTEKDIPQILPDEGYQFVAWQPHDPHGAEVESDMKFTAHFQELPTPPPPLPDEDSPNDTEGYSEASIEEGNDPDSVSDDSIYYDVDFNATHGGSLRGPCHYRKCPGDHIEPNEVPTPVADDGYQFAGWDRQPNGYLMGNANEEFTALFESIPTGKTKYWLWRHSFWHALLGWLAGLLLLALLLLLLWCFLFGNCWKGNCGCNCDCERIPEEIVSPTDTTNPEPDPTDTITTTTPCNEQVASGGDEGYSGYFDLGQQSGTFLFEYNTQAVPDEITIYDGRSTSGKVIWQYNGSTGAPQSTTITFSNRYVTVVVRGQQIGTYWEFKVGCPN